MKIFVHLHFIKAAGRKIMTKFLITIFINWFVIMGNVSIKTKLKSQFINLMDFESRKIFNNIYPGVTEHIDDPRVVKWS